MNKQTIIMVAVALAGAAWAAHPSDLDKDGKFSIDEFIALKKIQVEKAGKTFNEKLVRMLFNKKDQDKDGFLSLKELRENIWLKKKNPVSK